MRPRPTKESTTSDSESSLHVDVLRFRKLLSFTEQHEHAAIERCDKCHHVLSEVVSLCQSDFMAGFTLPDAPQFDDWQFFQADNFRQNLATTLEVLIKFHSNQE